MMFLKKYITSSTQVKIHTHLGRAAALAMLLFTPTRTVGTSPSSIVEHSIATEQTKLLRTFATLSKRRRLIDIENMKWLIDNGWQEAADGWLVSPDGIRFHPVADDIQILDHITSKVMESTWNDWSNLKRIDHLYRISEAQENIIKHNAQYIDDAKRAAEAAETTAENVSEQIKGLFGDDVESFIKDLGDKSFAEVMDEKILAAKNEAIANGVSPEKLAEIQTEINTKIEALEAADAALGERIKILEEKKAYDDTELAERVTQNESDIKTAGEKIDTEIEKLDSKIEEAKKAHKKDITEKTEALRKELKAEDTRIQNKFSDDLEDLEDDYEEAVAENKRGYEKADGELREGYRRDDDFIRKDMDALEGRVTNDIQRTEDDLKDLLKDNKEELEGDTLRLEDRIDEKIKAGKQLAAAETTIGDLQTQLALEGKMNSAHAEIKDGFRTADEILLDRMRNQKDLLEDRFNKLLSDQHNDFSKDLSSEVASLEDDFASVEKDLEAKNNELAKDLEFGLKDLDTKNLDLEEDIEDLEDVFSNELEALEDKFDDKMHDMEVAGELSDLKAMAMSGQPEGIEQHVNIDLDLGTSGYKDDGIADAFLHMEWWQYAFIGLGFAIVMALKCMFLGRNDSQLEDMAGPGLPY